jgi:Iap family predicted aminopeptidase
MIRYVIQILVPVLIARPGRAEQPSDSCYSPAGIQVLTFDSLKNGVIHLPYTLKETTKNTISDFWTILSAPSRINKKSALQVVVIRHQLIAIQRLLIR